MYAQFCTTPTPLVRLAHISRVFGANLFLKMEMCNPYGNAWMRHALGCLGAALARGELRPSGHVVDAADGGMALGLALAANALDLRLTLCLPPEASPETAALLRKAGAAVRPTKRGSGMAAARAEAEALQDACWYSFRPDLFTNPDAEKACAELGEEVLEQLGPETRPDALVAAVTTGATLAGAGGVLLRNAPACRLVAVVPGHEAPEGESVVTGSGEAAGAREIPGRLGRSHCHEALAVPPDAAAAAAQKLFAHEGLSGGSSTGAVLHAMITLAGRPEFKGKTIVGVAGDSRGPGF